MVPEKSDLVMQSDKWSKEHGKIEVEANEIGQILRLRRSDSSNGAIPHVADTDAKSALTTEVKNEEQMHLMTQETVDEGRH